MAQPQQRERRETREQLPSKEEYLENYEAWIAEAHKGTAPEPKITGYNYTEQKEERKEVCEDVSLKDDEMGLYMVADGVSTAGGWFASRETAIVCHEQLGEQLDKEVENLVSRMLADQGNGEQSVTTQMIDQHIMAKMVGALVEADRRVKQAGQLKPDTYAHSATTVALGKLVELPNGPDAFIQRFYFSSIGDSPIMIKRADGKLEQVTRDDSMIQAAIDAGHISKEQGDQIINAKDKYDLPREHHYLWGHRQTIVKSIGIGESPTDQEVFSIDLNPGDQIVMMSDGVSDQFTEQQLGQIVENGDGDDENIEAGLQNAALASARGGRRKNPRAKKDDIAAVAYTVRERGPSREYIKGDKKEGVERISVEVLRKQLEDLTGQLEVARTELQRLETEGRGLLPMTERLPAEMAVLEVEKQIEQTRYDIERAGLDKFDQEIPPRFKGGEVVRVMINTEQGRVPHPNQWRVSGFDETRSEYILQNESGQQFGMNRYQLELDQGTVRPQRGDVIPYYGVGTTEHGFTVTATDARGNVRVEKNKGQVVSEGQMDTAATQHAYNAMLTNAMRAKGRMDSYAAAFHRVNNELGEQQTRLKQVQEMEARNVVMTRFQQEIRDHKKALDLLSRQIEKAERILERFDELSKKEASPRGISSDERAELRKLKVKVYPTAQRPRLDESYIQQLRDERAKLQKKVITRKGS
jgi:serine/threonine protein phosphatase PrpC